jgi:hypothetical protein
MQKLKEAVSKHNWLDKVKSLFYTGIILAGVISILIEIFSEKKHK